ncbi:MAG: hypothetical protein D6B27_00955 [Gammaproteobacteria bacterium]|nr:MAG: hypothetical protein D6B27_00955 [Gammaproteobacteria bacterium]
MVSLHKRVGVKVKTDRFEERLCLTREIYQYAFREKVSLKHIKSLTQKERLPKMPFPFVTDKAFAVSAKGF